MNRLFYVLGLALHNIKANRFVAASVTILLSIGMVLTMFSFSYVRMLDARSAMGKQAHMHDVFELTLGLTGDAQALCEQTEESLKAKSSWQTTTFLGLSSTLYTEDGYMKQAALYVDPQSYPAMLPLSARIRQELGVMLQKGYLALGEYQASALGVTQNGQLVQVDASVYPAYIVKGIGSAVMFSSQTQVPWGKTTMLATFYYRPFEGIAGQVIGAAAQASALGNASEHQVIIRQSDVRTFTQTTQDILEYSAQQRGYYMMLSVGALALATLIMFSSVEHKLQREYRDTAIKLSVGAGYGGLFLQQLLEMTLYAIIAALAASTFVHFLLVRVINQLFEYRYILFDGYAVRWGALFGISAALVVSLGMLWRTRRMHLSQLLKGGAKA